jgi:hypothetical protein
MLRPTFLLRRMGSAWLLVGCLILSVLITAALVSALLSFYSAALPATVTQDLAKSGSLWVTTSDQVSGSPASVTRLVSSRMRTAFRGVPYRQYQASWSNDIALPGAHPGGNVPVIQAAAFTGISSYAQLSAGSWPSAPVAGRPIPVALPARVAADLRVGIGSELKLRYVAARTPVRLQVVGLFRPQDPAAAYWRLNQIGPSGVVVTGGFASYGPAVTSPAAFGAARHGVPSLQANDMSFVTVPQVAAIQAGGLDPLAARLTSAVTALQNAGVSLVTTTMPQTLINAAEGLAAARSLVVISGLQLLLLAAAALALAGRLLATHRDEETALLAARGGARWQLVWPSLAEGLLVCAVAAAAGAEAGVRLATLLLSNLIGHQQRALSVNREAWLGAGLVLVLCLGIVLWPALRPPGIAAVRIRRGRPAVIASAAAAGADLALIALAIVSVHELLSYSAAAPGARVDPVIAAAPMLALAGLALIPLRLLPLAAKGLEKATARGRRLGTAMANWEISRRPVRQSGPALLVILAVGTSTLALAQYQSWQQSVHDQAAFAAGAQVRVGLVNPEPLSGVTQITRLPGVTAAMPVSQQSLGTGQLLAIAAPQAAAIVLMRPDLSAPVPASQLWRPLSQVSPAGLAIPGRPDRLEIGASMAGGLADQLGPVSATLTVQDAFGLVYTVSTGAIPADGRSHELIAQLAASSGSSRPAYPLRLLGLSLTYDMPFTPTSRRAIAADAVAVVKLSSVAASDTPTGPFPAPFAPGSALARWRIRTSAFGLAAAISLLKGQNAGSQQPSVLHWAAAGQDSELKLAPGSGPFVPRAELGLLNVTSLPTLLEFTIPPVNLSVPLIATSAYLRATGLSDGNPVPLDIYGTSVSGYIAGTVSQFPTVTSGGAVVADQAALSDALISLGGTALPATSWWLRTADGGPPAGLPAGTGIVDAAALARTLQHDPISAAPVKAALAVAAAAAILAALGFCVSVTASARARRGQRALLAALGVSASAQARLFCLEEIMISGPSALVGLALGVGLAHLLIPAITLTATAGLPIPPVLVKVPVAWVALITIAFLAIPVLAATIATLMQPDPAAELRAAEAAG